MTINSTLTIGDIVPTTGNVINLGSAETLRSHEQQTNNTGTDSGALSAKKED